MAKTSSPLQRLLIGIVRFYQRTLSALLGPCCRFQPTCSHYAIEAINYHGSLKGCWLTAKRLLKCHPLCAGGYDPVPHADTNQETKPKRT